jgi:hemerythrin
MKNIQYIHLENHKKIHKQIIQNLQSIITDFDPQKLNETYEKVLDFVNNGLIQHIMIEDKKVQHYRRDKLGLRTMFTWKDDYLLENQDIDDDHKQLFLIAFKAFSHKDTQEPKQHIKKVIVELNDYMKEHFEREEKFMASIEFPLIDEHKQLHEKIINQINELIRRIPTMTIEQFERELLASIDIWLVNHIIHEDQKIMCFLSTNTKQAADVDTVEEFCESDGIPID